MNTEILRKAVIPTSVGVAGLSVGGVLGYILGLKKGRRRYIQLVKEAEEANLSNVDPKEFTGFTAYRSLPTGDLRDEVYIGKRHDITETGRVPYYTVPDGTGDPVLDDLLEWENKNDRIDNDILDAEAQAERDAIDEIANDVQESVDLIKPKNVFVDGKIYDASDDHWDWEAELNARSDKSIYVITREEFDADDMGYRQGTVTFYEGDRMVCDVLGEPIYNWTSHIGSELPFGHGSQDENVLFVRNENVRWEYEVCRDPGRFDVEQEGHDIQMAYEADDLKHSHGPLKMRRE